MKKLLLLVLLLGSFTAFSQGTITGKAMDSALGAPLSGANVIETGTTNGAITDFEGNFSLNASSNTGTITISYLGYINKKVSFTLKNGTLNLGSISLDTDANALDEVIIVGSGVIDLAEGRKTPVAVSTIKAEEIQAKVGTQDVTKALINTPSVYVAGESGGFGDSRISVRGFDQTNTAFLINGQPINGMEDGKMYWSNWSGMSDIANVIQIQRGLGSSKLAISSVGGTVNFVTNTTSKRQGGFVQAGVANDNYIKTTAAYDTGMMENGFGASVMLSHWQGDGYNDGTKGGGETYFISFGYKPNEKHNFNFLLTGAPQFHDQNFSKRISDYLDKGRKYNNNWGTLAGEYDSERRNFYHKPVANLNWDWDMSEKTSLSTVVYASWGRGGGTGNYGSRKRTDDGLVDFDAIYASNQAANGEGMFGNGTYLIRSSMNNHNWYGLVTNLNTELGENLNLNFGVDVRTYYGTHFRQVENFLGLNSWTESRSLKDGTHENATDPVFNTVTESFAADPWTATFNTMDEGQRIDYDNSERISYGGVFGQLEYSNDSFSAFFQGSVSSQSHQRFDRYDYLPANKDSEKVNNTGYNVKGGAGYKINENHSLFVNAGYYNRQPYHDNIFLNYTNRVNPFTENEKILGLEVGYKLTTDMIDVNLNGYRTNWKDRVTANSFNDSTSGDLLFNVNSGLEQLHTGVELDVFAKVASSLRLKGFASFGNWEYVGDVRTQTFTEDQVLVSEDVTDIDGGKVGDAAQITAGLGFDYEIVERLSIDADWRYNSDLYANRVEKENLELPSFDVVDAGLTYKMLVGKNKTNSVKIRLNVNNLFYKVYISELTTTIKTTDLIDEDDPSLGTYESNGEVYNGIATTNQGYFGLGRTWNASIKFNF